MLDRKMVINELRKRGYIAEEKNVVKNGVICDGISIHLPETKMENEKVQSVFGVMILSILVDTFLSRISLTMLPAPNLHNTSCVLS